MPVKIRNEQRCTLEWTLLRKKSIYCSTEWKFSLWRITSTVYCRGMLPIFRYSFKKKKKREYHNNHPVSANPSNRYLAFPFLEIIFCSRINENKEESKLHSFLSFHLEQTISIALDYSFFFSYMPCFPLTIRPKTNIHSSAKIASFQRRKKWNEMKRTWKQYYRERKRRTEERRKIK